MKKSILKRLISMILAMVLLCTTLTNVFAYDNKEIIDLSQCCPYDSWAAEAAKNNKFIFLEDVRRNIKRWEIASILSFMITQSDGEGADFIDLNEMDSKYKERIKSVSKNGIVLGYSDGTFKPFENVTRAEFVTMLSRTKLFDGIENNINVQFNDISNHWAKNEIQKIAGTGIVNGKGNNKFCPNDCITIQEIFIILDRIKAIKAIDKEVFFKCLQETFSCRKYTDNESYIVETMYLNYDEVQNAMNLYWFYDNRYDTSKWNGYATYKDLSVAYYSLFSDMENDTDYKELPVLIGELDIFEAWNIPAEFKHLIYVFGSNVGYQEKIVELKFTNVDIFDDYELNRIAVAVYHNKAIQNAKYYLPWDNCKVSRYMLTCALYNSIIKGNSFGKLWDEENYPYEFKLSTNNLPSNYKDYPYILTTVPKSVYEKPFIKKTEMYTPKECYDTYADYYDEMSYYTKKFFDVTLNVDYTTMNIDEFVENVYDCAYASVTEDQIRAYAQYVIDNKIILKGSGYLIPATPYISGIFVHGRVMVEFEVVSAKERVNLLLADAMNYENIYYKSNKYQLCYDHELIPIYNFDSGEIGIFNVYVKPIARYIYGYDDVITEF